MCAVSGFAEEKEAEATEGDDGGEEVNVDVVVATGFSWAPSWIMGVVPPGREGFLLDGDDGGGVSGTAVAVVALGDRYTLLSCGRE